MAALAMTHSGIAGIGYVQDMATFTAVWQPLGWVLSAIPGQAVVDSLGYGHAVTLPPQMANGVLSVGAANRAWYARLMNGAAISKVRVEVGTSSGNISVAAYTNSGVGAAAAPTGGQLATSGAVACPASGVAEVSLGVTVTVQPGDWLALSCDNNTATFRQAGAAVLAAVPLAAGHSGFQATAHPLPATPSLTAGVVGPIILIGVP